MISSKSIYGRLVVIGCVLVIFSGCAAAPPRVPIKLDPSFSEMGIQTVALLPVIDRRVDKSYEIDLDKEIRNQAKKTLEKKGYAVLMPDTFAEGKAVELAEVVEMEVNDLALLGPRDARVIVLIYLEDILSSYKVLSYAFKIEATASMVSQEKQVELWRDKGIGRSGQGGLISGLTKGLDKSSAINTCINSMFYTLPAVPK